MSENLTLAIGIVMIIFFVIGIIVFIYTAFVLRKFGSAAKKVNYFFEDLTYKSEMLNSTVEAVNRISNYIDLFDAFAKRNVKSWAKVATQNKDIAYKIVDKLRDFANSANE
ncbi:hypothetical protein [Spiroplasma endosymbiont of Othius punctulatus]|uniref:hypothetical protein n=1 Tax=Spiroplasma endosymbiont of Othius punctulatus TaxID=3066289 RepID=UPI0030D33B8F